MMTGAVVAIVKVGITTTVAIGIKASIVADFKSNLHSCSFGLKEVIIEVIKVVVKVVEAIEGWLESHSLRFKLHLAIKLVGTFSGSLISIPIVGKFNRLDFKGRITLCWIRLS